MEAEDRRTQGIATDGTDVEDEGIMVCVARTPRDAPTEMTPMARDA